jgi:hypothetical protein
MQSYRPISLLCDFSKISKKAEHNMLISFLLRNIILTEAQNGFRKKTLTETVIHFFLESTQESIKKRILIGIFCDLTKACDAVN